MYHQKIEIILASLIILTGNEIVGILLSISGIVYYLTMIKINAIDKKYKGSWKLFIKAILNKFR